MLKNRRDFIKKAALAGASVAAIPALQGCNNGNKEIAALNGVSNLKDNKLKSKLIVPQNNGIKISGTFLDEISHDISHQNWGEA